MASALIRSTIGELTQSSFLSELEVLCCLYDTVSIKSVTARYGGRVVGVNW